jgi:hypothetical protein
MVSGQSEAKQGAYLLALLDRLMEALLVDVLLVAGATLPLIPLTHL